MPRSERNIDWPQVVLETCRRIESAKAAPTLSALAEAASASASELQRQFSRRLGISPKGYAQALKLQRLTRGLAQSPTTLDAVLEAGFESVSSAYSNASTSLGTSPGRLRNGIAIGWWMGLSDLGWMLMAATDKGICWLSFGDQPETMLEELRAAFPRARLGNDERRLGDWFERVREFVLLPEESLDLPVDIQGTAFQAGVWNALRQIPIGATVSYSRLAEQLGRPQAARAVATACARNRVSVIIPCHRVIARDGSLAGYRWGVERKARLLERERQARGQQG